LTVAFILRNISIIQPNNKGIYEAQFILILIAPLWINAFDYMLLGRMIWYFLPEKKVFGIKAQWCAGVFVISDIITFIIQLAGASQITSTDYTTQENGLHIYTAGVGLQEMVILVFTSLAWGFQKRLFMQTDRADLAAGKRLSYVLYTTLGLISFRIIYRIIEFSAGSQSKLSNTISNNEWFAYVFDSMPMFFALALFNVFHPGRTLVGPESEFPKLTKEEKKQKKMEKKLKKIEKKEAKKHKKEEQLRMKELSSAESGASTPSNTSNI